MPRRVHVVAGALWRVVEKLMNARIDRDTDLHTLLITAREAGNALLANAEHNDKLRERFENAYGEDIKEYFNKCMGEKAKDGDLDADYAEYLCWYSLLLRVFLILRAPTAQELERERLEEAEEEASEVGE
jgi:hypothetical protein